MSESHAGHEFVQDLHWALQHLYDPPELRKSPLLALFDLAERRNPADALEQLIAGAIGSLRPTGNAPQDSAAWRIYHVLHLRYVERAQQRVVAAQLGYSIRQMRRQESAAVEMLADVLWPRAPKAQARNQGPASTLREPGGGHANEAELEQIRASFPSETADVAALIATALRNVAPLARATQTLLDLRMDEGRPPVAGQVAPMQQGLQSLLSAAVQSAPGGRVRLAVKSEAAAIVVDLQVECASAAQGNEGDTAEGLAMARRLLELCGGRLVLEGAASCPGGLRATVWLPAGTQQSVLVVDDNADALQLIGRYLAGTRYRFTGTRDPEAAVSIASEAKPVAILLDVMLPGIDGWELLGRLREHPRTAGVPVIVCTILPQERVALTLGAAGFLRKPLTRETLLASLDQLLAAHPPAPV